MTLSSSQIKQLVLIYVAVPVFAAIYFIVKSRQQKLKESGKYEQEQERKIYSRYIFYMNNVLLRKRFRHIVVQFSSLACYDVKTVREKSVKLFERSVLSACLMPLVALILFQNVMLAALSCLIGYIYYNMAVDKAIDKVYMSIVSELATCVQSIHDGYVMSGSIPKAVLESDKGTLLEKPISYIYDILTDIDGENMLYEFKKTTPVRMLGTLATVCFVMNNEGDSGYQEGEQSAFESVMTAIRREADTEIRRLKKTKLAFSSLSGVALVGLVASPFLDKFLLTQIPGTSLYLNGLYGSFEKALIIGITSLVYYLISILVRPSVVNQVDRNYYVLNLSKNRKVKKFVNTLIPKKYKTRKKLEFLMNDAVSSKSLGYIYTLKPVASIIAMLCMTLLITGFIITAKQKLWGNTGSLSVMKTTQVMTEKLKKQLVILDEEYMTAENKMSDDETLELVKGRLTGVSDTDALMHVDRLSLKWDTYYGLTFKWYYVLLVYAAGVVAWFTPEISLKMRKKLVEFEANEDVMQLQTLMIALSNTKLDVYKTLFWLASESTIHKAPLHYAYLEYPSNPELALQRLKDSVQNENLKRMVSKLERAVYSLSLSEAFNDIKIDKEQSLIMSEIQQDEVIESKKQWAKLLASMPTYIAVIGGFVLPILILGVVQLMSSLSGLSS
jgi:hypothetical protein